MSDTPKTPAPPEITVHCQCSACVPSPPAEESAPLCAKCGLTRGTLIHRPAEFADDPGAEDCHPFVTGVFVEGEAEPPLAADPRIPLTKEALDEMRRAIRRSEKVSGEDRATRIRADESRATREPAWHNCPACERAHVGYITSACEKGYGCEPGIEAGQTCEHIDADPELLRKLHAAEEARRLAEQELDETGQILAEAMARPVGAEHIDRRIVDLARQAASTLASFEGWSRGGYWRKAADALRAEVERLQGELAGLREAAQQAHDLLNGYNGTGTRYDFSVPPPLRIAEERLRAALAPQEDAEKGTKG